jgi:hypothetical protein
LIGLFDAEGKSNKMTTAKKLVQKESSTADEVNNTTASVTNYNFSFSNNSSSINFGAFNFPAGGNNRSILSNSYEHESSLATADFNRPYGSFSSAEGPDVIIQEAAVKDVI